MRELIQQAVPNVSGREAQNLMECIRSGYVSSVGPFVTEFEQRVAAAAGVEHGVATNSGTTGLHLALVAAGVCRDDIVIIPSFTFIATANAVSHCCAVPWLIDIDESSWTLSVSMLEKCLACETEKRNGHWVHTATGRRVAAIMPVHTLGSPADMGPISDLARTYGLPVVADAAAALGATYRGEKLGPFSELTVFSFNGNKTITAGGGGIVTGRDSELLALARHLSTTARVGDEYHHDRVGFNYRMTNLQAAVGCAQMERLDEFVSSKRRIAARYNDSLGQLPCIGTFPAPTWSNSACWLSGIVIQDPHRIDPNSLRSRLRERGISARQFWKPVHLQPPYRDVPRAVLPVSESIWQRIVILPCSTDLSVEQQDYVVETVTDLINRV